MRSVLTLVYLGSATNVCLVSYMIFELHLVVKRTSYLTWGLIIAIPTNHFVGVLFWDFSSSSIQNSANLTSSSSDLLCITDLCRIHFFSFDTSKKSCTSLSSVSKETKKLYLLLLSSLRSFFTFLSSCIWSSVIVSKVNISWSYSGILLEDFYPWYGMLNFILIEEMILAVYSTS